TFSSELNYRFIPSMEGNCLFNSKSFKTNFSKLPVRQSSNHLPQAFGVGLRQSGRPGYASDQ
ncbi:hypothetical protein, partial [Thiolapillus sp.]|uniref:hypothetical protein n=1 Tax=Thiolapillus sp. TaxID=2017437 RepID=UPI003AF9140C